MSESNEKAQNKAGKKAAKEKAKADKTKDHKHKTPEAGYKSALRTLYWLCMSFAIIVVFALGYEAVVTAINGLNQD